MTVWNLGSINADFFYSVPHLPQPGETLSCSAHTRGLGGKGANISVAAARAAAHVCHIGRLGHDGAWALEQLLEYGVDTRFISTGATVTGHAIIATDVDGENTIILLPGANAEIAERELSQALTQASSSDWFVTQNETNEQVRGAQLAKQLGLKVAYVAAPFDADAVSQIRPYLDLLILNAVEAQQLADALGQAAQDLGISDVIVTEGSAGASWYAAGNRTHVPAIDVDPVDTTGAGDTFAGYVLACLDRGLPMAQALQTATRAAAIMVTRRGTADVIPDLKDLEDFVSK